MRAAVRFNSEDEMKPVAPATGLDRRTLLSILPALGMVSRAFVPVAADAQTPSGTLPSWNDGPAKQAILDFVRATTDQASPSFVPPPERIATFDQDGTLWVEHPMYSQVILFGPRARRGEGETRIGECRAIQDCSLRQPGGNGKAFDARPGKDTGRDAHRHVGG